MAFCTPSDLDFVTRFVCIGSEEGSYNVLAASDFTDKTPSLSSFLCKEKGKEAIDRLRKIFQNRSYITKEPLLYALAKIIRNTPVSKNHEEDDIRIAAYSLAQDACESAMDLFTFVHYDKVAAEPKKAGWGRGMRRLVSRWYDSKTPLKLASEVTKCKSGRGWTHRDLLRQCHIKPDRKSKGLSVVVDYVVHRGKKCENFPESDDKEVQEVVAFLKDINSLASSQPTEGALVRSLIEKHKFTERQIPSFLFQSPETFEGLLGHMKLEDIFKSIPKMASLGMLHHASAQVGHVMDIVKNLTLIQQEKIHPIVIFLALRRYEADRSKKWIKNYHLIKALHAAFNVSLQSLPRIGKRMLLAVHVDNKVAKQHVSGANFLSPIMPCALMAKFLLESEDNIQVVFFHQKVIELNIRRKTTMAGIIEQFINCTKEPANAIYDISEPLKWATQNKKLFDNILIISDKKIVSSHLEFHETVKLYRREVSLPNAKLVYISLSDFSYLNDKNDLNTLEISGFNERIPPMVYKFFLGKFDFTEDLNEAAALP
ncbi:unnamed protein product [Lymnaea stagnalis]|uniref:TROVE domain-containing protein n=1 Tax=Lymnaea stagnalis TaxID=6523 RepID=A0AAV2H2I7_LYMST